MKKLLLFFGVCCPMLFTATGFGMGQKGDWIGGGGFGLMLSPGLVLLSPQLEYVYEPDLNFGSLVQMGFGGEGLLLTISGSVRAVYGDPKSKWRPTAEGAFGLAMDSGLYKSTFGVHVMASGGVEYTLDKTTTIGTMLRFNFTPPLKGLFVSWPLIIGRFKL